MPTVSWRHVTLATLFALAIAELAGAGIASVAAVGTGAYVAGRLARHHGLLQGAATGSSFVIVVALLDSITAVPLLPSDTILLVVLDTLHLAAGAAGGWLATRS